MILFVFLITQRRRQNVSHGNTSLSSAAWQLPASVNQSWEKYFFLFFTLRVVYTSLRNLRNYLCIDASISQPKLEKIYIFVLYIDNIIYHRCLHLWNLFLPIFDPWLWLSSASLYDKSRFFLAALLLLILLLFIVFQHLYCALNLFGSSAKSIDCW